MTKHLKPLKPILDPASSSRMFYFDKEDSRVLFGDIRTEQHILSDGRHLEINPEMEMDFRALPFEDESFRMVIFDPPHLVKIGEESWMAKKYGRLDEFFWERDLTLGFEECFRVLEPLGVLVFKWNEYDIPLSQVLSLTKQKPIVGHPSGKHSKTHWVIFMKEIKDA